LHSIVDIIDRYERRLKIGGVGAGYATSARSFHGYHGRQEEEQKAKINEGECRDG